MKRQHYYSFAFSYSEGNKTTTASVYIGYDYKFISMPQITGAKKAAGINNNAVMLDCCYLGKMTKQEVETGITQRCTLIRKAASFWNKLKEVVCFSYK